MLTAGVFAQEKTNKMEDKKMASHKMKDCVMMEDGKMVVMKDGQTMPMDKDMTMKNGVTVMTDGNVKWKNGKTTMLKEGQYVTMDGKMAMMHMGKMSKSKKKSE
jgi:hypothetical protein